MVANIRAAVPDDLPVCGRVMYEAFKNIADQHKFPPDFPNADAAAGLLGMMLGSPGFDAAVAEENGLVVGSIFFSSRSDVGGISVITVAPESQNRAVGRQLMLHGMESLSRRGHTRQQLVQAGYHNRSLCLYAKLGFNASDMLSNMTGGPVKATIANRTVRTATETDTEDCNKLCRNVHGFDRPLELDSAIKAGVALVVENEGRVTGYTSGVGFVGHGVGETNDDLKALITSVDEFAGPGILIPTNNSEIFNWCLDNGLRVVQQMILMDTIPAQIPKGAYWPSVLC